MPPEKPSWGRHMSQRNVRSHGYANRTLWQDATREVPAAWLVEEARSSPSPYSLLASWKGERGGVPSHVMIKLLRRRLVEQYPELMKTPLPPAELQSAQDMLKQIWARAGGVGERHPMWRLVESVLRVASEQMTTPRIGPDEPAPPAPDGAG